MDLHWRVARMRKWIELGDRDGLTFVELAKRAGVTKRTARRWCVAMRKIRAVDQFRQLHESPKEHLEPSEQPPPLAVPPAPEPAFVQLLEPAPSKPTQVQILLAGDRRRVLVDGAVDVEVLARVIEAADRC
jgi:hypothetical protein